MRSLLNERSYPKSLVHKRNELILIIWFCQKKQKREEKYSLCNDSTLPELRTQAKLSIKAYACYICIKKLREYLHRVLLSLLEMPNQGKDLPIRNNCRLISC